MAVFAVQLAGICTRPASREACRRAAVKPRPSCMSPYAPARRGRAVRGAGALPLLVEFDDAGVLGDDLLLVVDKGGAGVLRKGGLLAVYQHFHFFHSGELGAGE